MTRLTKPTVKPSLWTMIAAPLTWLERLRGRKRGILFLVYAFLLVCAGLFAWRAFSLRNLPDIKEPFDRPDYGTVTVADRDNAFISYRQASAKLKPKHADVERELRNGAVITWSAATPLLQRYVEDNRSALSLWLEGTRCREALNAQPRNLTLFSSTAVFQELRILGKLAAIEGSRREQAGDLKGAWEMYRGVLRSSRHIGMHGPAVSRLLGSVLLRLGGSHADTWMASSGITPALLRTALSDVAECAAMTPPASDMVCAEHFMMEGSLRGSERQRLRNDLRDDTRWYNHVAFVPETVDFMNREPERSIRVLRALTAGYLAQCDRPQNQRPRLAFPEYMIYQRDSATPAALRALTPEELCAWVESSMVRSLSPAMAQIQPRADAEGRYLDELQLRLAEAAFRLEHGRPFRRYAELVGPYLKALPEGYEPDQIPAPAESSQPIGTQRAERR